MGKSLPAFLFSALVSLFSSDIHAAFVGDQWADVVISFDQPSGSSSEGDLATAALGAPDATGGGSGTGFVSIDIPEVLTLAFVDNSATNGDGFDLTIHEYLTGDSSVEVYASKDSLDYTFLGIANGTASFDFAAHANLQYVNYVRLVGLDNGGVSAGFDLDAIEALYPVEPVPLPASLPLFLTGLSCLLFRVKKKRAVSSYFNRRR